MPELQIASKEKGRKGKECILSLLVEINDLLLILCLRSSIADDFHESALRTK
jgi:hypothetical protein